MEYFIYPIGVLIIFSIIVFFIKTNEKFKNFVFNPTVDDDPEITLMIIIGVCALWPISLLFIIIIKGVCWFSNYLFSPKR